MSLKMKTGKTKGLVTALLLIGLFFALPQTAFAAWDGSTRDQSWYTPGPGPFNISSEAELAGLADLVNGGTNFSGITIDLTADLDLGGHPWMPIGEYFNSFQGIFDGGGHTISGLAIGTSSAPETAYQYIGLFGYVNSGSIADLGILDCAIYTVSPSGAFAGGLAGYNNQSDITNCYATGTLSATGQACQAGGLVGRNHQGNIINAYAAVNVTGFTTSDSNEAHVGGLAGYNYRGAIINAYATGTVTVRSTDSSASAGGLAGCTFGASSNITNCYATGAVSGYSDTGIVYPGGLVGTCHDESASFIITDSYFNRTSPNDALKGIGGDAGQNQEGNITPMTLAGMQTQAFANKLNDNVDVLGGSPYSYWTQNDNKNNGLPYFNNGMWVPDTPSRGSGGNTGGGSYSYGGSGDSDRDNSDPSAGGALADYIYRITFDSQGGSAVDIQRVREGRYAAEPAEPKREGYDFTGWYTDKDCTRAYDFGKRVTGSFTLYAGWDLLVQDDGKSHLPEREILGTVPYKPYISGYPDGAFGPENPISRAEVAAILYRLAEITDMSGNGQEQSFIDVYPGDWYYDAVIYLSSIGVLSGYPGGEFSPADRITRAEFSVIVTRFVNIPAHAGEVHFSDTIGHWAEDAIAAAEAAGLAAGYGNGDFGPDDALTRAQAVVILNQILGRDIDKALLGSMTMPFTDVSQSHWAYWHIMTAAVGKAG